MIKITETVKHLIIINVLMFILPMFLWNDDRAILALHYFESDNYQHFQFATSMFMHGDEIHLLFNMYMLYFLGSLVERYWGAKKFLTYYLICGVGASIFSMIVDYIALKYWGIFPSASWGASGAIFGLFMAAALLFPNHEVQLIIPPIPLKFKVLVPLYMILELYLGMSNAQTGIGHFAHIGGAVCGFILIMIWGKGSNINRWN